jgi:hypothetical protein
VYAAASSALQHGLPRRHRRIVSTLRASSHRPRDSMATNRRSACELGISSMSENSCTARDARLDSVCDDAREALRGVAERDFRRKKNSAYISAEGRFEAHQERAEERESRESGLSDSQTRVLGSICRGIG